MSYSKNLNDSEQVDSSASSSSQTTTKQIKAAKIIRTITISPIIATISAALIWIFSKETNGFHLFWLTALFLGLLPVLAYPTYRTLAIFKPRTRKKERAFAIIMSILGYVLGLIVAAITSAQHFIIIVFLTYFISAILVGLSSKLLHFNASGHACAIAGPAVILVHKLGLVGLAFAPVVIAVFWSSLKLKRHTLLELVVGTIIPIATYYLLVLF